MVDGDNASDDDDDEDDNDDDHDHEGMMRTLVMTTQLCVIMKYDGMMVVSEE